MLAFNWTSITFNMGGVMSVGWILALGIYMFVLIQKPVI